ncbi:MAG: hypothetical protein ABGX87_07325 [Alcanivorax sp.]|uniref:Uncharacterized protein n=1 Tax=Alloalcanivorax marinus TaxID=1177169 RepID=A0A9Q3YQ16_9GAMM|nr:hypothetical protein [Alloalcanivorax marinus]MBM7334896.1 hypothetical protein [Alloalcanivorax marinus]MCC4310516.1 hypothetical protein [Alloalcanivorax marinus]MCU5788229.1 hypothetical protein [Alloalcanivorax marinus]
MNLRRPLSSLFSLNALVWLAMLTGLATLLCFAAAGWLALAPHVGAPLASLYTGLGLLVVTVLLALLVRRAVASKPEAPSRHQTPAAEARLEDSLRPLIGDSAVRWTRDNSSLVAIGALAAGVLIAASPGTRRFLTRAAGPVVTRKALEAYRGYSNDQD